MERDKTEMNKTKKLPLLVVLILAAGCQPACANSSWHWVTASPLTLFPFAVVFTLLIETIVVHRFGRTASLRRTATVVSLANLASFLAPYLFRAYHAIPVRGGFDVIASFERGPFYMVLTGYLLLTLLVEVPIVMWRLSRKGSSRPRLLMVTIGVNALTTLLVAVVERVICHGVG